jgi:hypothetical protein
VFEGTLNVISNTSSSSSLGATALREPWPPVLFASTGLYPELSFSILLISNTYEYKKREILTRLSQYREKYRW